MKKILSFFLASLISILCLTPATTVLGAECEHNFLREAVPANCLEKGHTLYTCRRCGLITKTYDDEYTAPDSFYIVAESTREGDTLIVTAKLFNSPGLVAARIRVGYNASTLVPREFINGEIWTQKDFTAGDINLRSNPISILTEDYSTGHKNNAQNGLYFTMIFDVIDPEGSYNVYFTHEKGDFPSWDSSANAITKNTPTIINLVGKSELGPHSYEETHIQPPTCEESGYTFYMCALCETETVKKTADKTGHSLTLKSIITESTLTKEGLGIYECTECGHEETGSVPVLEPYKKGDLNNDGFLTPIDCNILKRFLAGFAVNEQAQAAADFNNDGQCNSQDAYVLKLVVAGVMSY